MAARTTATFVSALALVLVSSSCVADALSVAYNVTEHAPLETRIGNLTADIFRMLRINSGPTLSYILLHCTNKVAINAAGELIVIDDLDREEVSSLRCAVAVNRFEAAADQRVAVAAPIPNQVTLLIAIIDVNDQLPRWELGEQIRIEFAENEPQKATRAIPLAIDADATASKLSYNKTRTTLVNGTRLAHDPFQLAVGPTSLLVSLNSRLDYENVAEYRFWIIASDGRHNATLEVHVRVRDVNEFAPHFPNSTYVISLLEDWNAYSGNAFARVAAVDLDGTDREEGLQYSIVPSSQLFEIDEVGDLKLLRELDFEQSRLHTFTVIAKDQGQLSASASVTVSVLDVNDFPPRITGICRSGVCTSIDVAENEAPGLTDFKVHVSDEDSGRFGDVQCALAPDSDSDKFTLTQDGLSKVFLLGTRTRFNRESAARYIVTIVCEDDGGVDKKSAEMRVTVNVLDRNDCVPRLAALHAQAGGSSQVSMRDNMPLIEVLENAYVDSVIATLRAEDCDEVGAVNSKVNFRLIEETVVAGLQPSAEHGALFNLSPDGTLSLARPLDRETISDYQIKVLLFDEGVPPLNSTSTIRIRVLDVVDTPPLFSNRSYRFTLPENVPIGHVIAQLNVSDPDDETLNGLTFQVTEWPAHAPRPNQACVAPQSFTVDSLGALRTLSHINREFCSEYVFQVVAIDSARLRDTANILLTVLDQNDNWPRFVFPTPSNNSVRVRFYRENAPIAQVTAVDDDDSSECEINYSLRNAPVGKADLFQINERHGDVLLRRRPLGSDVGQHRLTVEASDCWPVRHNITQTLLITIDKEAIEAAQEDNSLTTAQFENIQRPNRAGVVDNFVLMVCLVSVFGCMIVLALVALFVLCKRFTSPRSDGSKTRRTANRKRFARGLHSSDANNNEQSVKMMLTTPSSSTMRKSTSLVRAAHCDLSLCERENADNEKNVVCEACKLSTCEAVDIHDKTLALKPSSQSSENLSPSNLYRPEAGNSLSELSEESTTGENTGESQSEAAHQAPPDRCTLLHCTISTQEQLAAASSSSNANTRVKNDAGSPTFSVPTRCTPAPVAAPATDSMKKRQLVQTVPRRPQAGSMACDCADCIANGISYRSPMAMTMTDLWLSPSQRAPSPKQVFDAEMMSFVPRSSRQQQQRTLPRSTKVNAAAVTANNHNHHSNNNNNNNNNNEQLGNEAPPHAQARSSIADQSQPQSHLQAIQTQTRLKTFTKPLDSASYV